MLFNLPALQKLVVIKSDVKLEHTEAHRSRYSSAAERLQRRLLYHQYLQRSEFEDGYRLISGRSQDRNLLPASHPLVALQKLPVVLTQHLSNGRTGLV